MLRTVYVPEGYEKLFDVFCNAIAQASEGKGSERHSDGEPFEKQPICKGTRRFGIGAALFQAWKKIHEVPVLYTMTDGDNRALRELYGAMNYAAACVIIIEEDMPKPAISDEEELYNETGRPATQLLDDGQDC